MEHFDIDGNEERYKSHVERYKQGQIIKYNRSYILKLSLYPKGNDKLLKTLGTSFQLFYNGCGELL